MIHRLHAADALKRPLLRSTFVQLNVLHYAARVTVVTERDCADHLQQIYGPDGVGIAEWVFANEERHTPLAAFAAAPGTTQDKRQWLRVLKTEVKRFSREHPSGALTVLSPDVAALPAWAEAARQYLKAGYAAFRKPRLPEAVAGTAQSGYDFIHEFRKQNPRVYMCPACDGSRQIDDPDGKRPFTSLDHFLPQDSYPHLALHPRNLVPVCAACNTKKSSTDPLKTATGYRDLSDITLPYDCVGWKETTYMHVMLTGPQTASFAGVVSDRAVPALPESVAVHLDLYKVLSRWNDRSHDVGYRMFRRLRQYFMEVDMDYRGADRLDEMQQRLDRMLAFCYEDVGCEPDAYAVTWWLATMIKAELTQAGATAAASPLVAEITAWLDANQKLQKEFSGRGEKVRLRLP